MITMKQAALSAFASARALSRLATTATTKPILTPVLPSCYRSHMSPQMMAEADCFTCPFRSGCSGGAD